MGADVIDTSVSDIDVTDDNDIAAHVTDEVDGVATTEDTAFISTTDVFSPLVSFCN